jgi:hypothetical protein
MLSPKARFLLQPTQAEIHRALVVNGGFKHAVDMSLLDLLERLTAAPTTDIQSAAANWNQIAGAHRFVKTLLTLGDSGTVSKPPEDRTNLKNV